jgi:predicted enzyme related to lactoylglutathione lyase
MNDSPAESTLLTDLLVNIDVDDLRRAIAFYTSAFELRVGRRFGAGAVELLGAKVPIYLLVKAADAAPFEAATAARSYRRHWTPVHLDFVVESLERALQRAEAAGAIREGEVLEHDWGKLALLSDPWGHGFCLLQFTGRGYEALATGVGGEGPSAGA